MELYLGYTHSLGHGFNIEVLSGNIFLAYWYLFDNNGNNLWLGGVSNGAFSGDTAVVNLTQTTGGTYPPLDPTKIVRLALQGAASIAALLITTEAMVAEKPEKAAPAMSGGGMGGGGTDF